MRRYTDWAGPATNFMHDRQPQRRPVRMGVCKARVPRGRRPRCALGEWTPARKQKQPRRVSRGKTKETAPNSHNKNKTTPAGALALDGHGYGCPRNIRNISTTTRTPGYASFSRRCFRELSSTAGRARNSPPPCRTRHTTRRRPAPAGRPCRFGGGPMPRALGAMLSRRCESMVVRDPKAATAAPASQLRERQMPNS